jgi:ATP-dependent protease ClpP protease subunit
MAKTVYFNLQASITQEIATKMIAAVEDNLRKGMTDLHLLMASGGGFTDPGMAIYNFLRGIGLRVIAAKIICQ